MYVNQKFKVLKNELIAENIYDITVETRVIANTAQAGQFVHILADGFTLRRPISICGVDKNSGTIRLIIEAKGAGTKKIIATTAYDSLDMIGPLGNGVFKINPSGRNIFVGGGVGTPPLLFAAKQASSPVMIMGFRSKEQVILGRDFSALGETFLVTEDGSVGEQGRVTDPLKRVLKSSDTVHVCGPTPMLRAVKQLCEKTGATCYLSFEERMGCGVGACLVCACKNSEGGFSHACKDGPVFRSDELVL